MEFISKKELLEETGISYGQLYRWKRERLIPEEWFVKRSAFTGQETFFPREQILPRIQAILDNKDQYSLGELSRMLSMDNAEAMEPGTLDAVEEISPAVRQAVQRVYKRDSYALFELALFAAVSRAAETLTLPPHRIPTLTERAISASTLQDLNSVLTVFFTGDGVHCALSKDDSPLVLDSSVETLTTVSVFQTANDIKMKYRDLFPTL